MVEFKLSDDSPERGVRKARIPPQQFIVVEPMGQPQFTVRIVDPIFGFHVHSTFGRAAGRHFLTAPSTSDTYGGCGGPVKETLNWCPIPDFHVSRRDDERPMLVRATSKNASPEIWDSSRCPVANLAEQDSVELALSHTPAPSLIFHSARCPCLVLKRYRGHLMDCPKRAVIPAILQSEVWRGSVADHSCVK